MQKDSDYVAGGKSDGAVASPANGGNGDSIHAELIAAILRGVCPPQNWTTRAIDEITRLKCLLAQRSKDAAIPEGLIERVIAARQRIEENRAPRRIPADPTDVDLVLNEVLMYLNGTYERPFWLGDQSGIKDLAPPAK